METKWVNRWGSWITPAPVKPGVFRRKEGGFLVRGRTTDRRTGKMKEVRLNLVGVDALREQEVRIVWPLAAVGVMIGVIRPEYVQRAGIALTDEPAEIVEVMDEP